MSTNLQNNSDDNRLQAVTTLLEGGTLQQATKMLNALRPAEIAHLLESLPLTQRKVVWELLDEQAAGVVLLDVTDEVRESLLQEMDLADIVAATEGLEIDDLADLVKELPRHITWEVIDSLDHQYRERLESVLPYPEDSAGGLMNLDTVTVRAEVTIDVVMRYLRRLGEKVPKDTDKLFVVNRDGLYLGAISLSRILTNDPDDSVAEVMSLDIQPIPADWNEREVANRFEQHDLLSAPVVDEEGHLLGRITIDDVVDVIREEGEHQFMGHAGLSEDEDMFAPVLVSAQRRALWLGINLLTAFLASWVIRQFESTIDQIVALAVLMPIVASMGGIAGTQTLTLAIRGIALGQLSANNSRWLMIKELAVGGINSVIWAVVVGVIAGIWFQNTSIALLIAAAITINLLFAALAGAALPLLLEKLGIDPALAGGVLLTTITDVVGFLAFLGLATIFLL
ncbi:MAG: magnesium transporter [Candidatus Thiodiazotropha sp. (ex Monitilora ramsayi)]|nr:magnesium transporter [Candidatus Thiodiazotropha sp. (ex Monitilora ramsayi)]